MRTQARDRRIIQLQREKGVHPETKRKREGARLERDTHRGGRNRDTKRARDTERLRGRERLPIRKA